MKISDYIGEGTEYEKKERLEENKPKNWLKSVIAFANGTGGALIFGVSDDDAPRGLENAKADSEKISEFVKARIDPLPDMDLNIQSEKGKDFIILKVRQGQETPYYYAADGNRIAFVRVGNESVPASSAELRRLVLRGANTAYDNLATGYRREDFAFTKLSSAYHRRTNLDWKPSDFLSFGLVNDKGMLTNAGALMADEPPLRFSRIFCTRWNGLDKASGVMEAIDDREIAGSLITLLEGGEEFIRHNTKKGWKKTATGRIELPEYPERAVLECLVNAIIHRDYTIVGSEVHIDIFDDRLEITSPGGMLDGSFIQNRDTDNIASVRRNPFIADLFNRMNYMERRGSGFKKIKADYRSAVNFRPEREPKFYSDNAAFRVTLSNLNYNMPDDDEILSDKMSDNDNLSDKMSDNEILSDKMSDKEKAVYRLILAVRENEKFITTKYVAERTGYSVSTIRRYLKHFCELGFIKAAGERKSRKYFLPVTNMK